MLLHGKEVYMKAVVTVVGVDKPGIIARVSNILYKNDINILDISQTIMEEMFTMIMMVDISGSDRGKFFAAQVNVLISTRVCT